MSDDSATRHTSAITALQEQLDVVNHEDPDKHYIGGALPVASDSELRSVGVNTTAGSSPLPARADHVHGIKMPYAVANLSSGVTIPNTGVRTYINTWTHTGGENWIGGTPQTIDMDRPGLYLLHFHIQMQRSGGGAMGPGHLNAGITFGGSIVYYFRSDYLQATHLAYQSNNAQFHTQSAANWVEFWIEHSLPGNVDVTSAQFVGTYMSGLT